MTDAATIVAGLSAVVVAGTFVLRGQGASEPARPDSDRLIDEWQVLAQAGHDRGAGDAPVVVIEFGDYECPACRMFQPVMEEALATYGEKIRFVYRHWPLTYHAGARPAAVAAECAGQQGHFWSVHERLFRIDQFSASSFTDLAREVGVPDISEFNRCVSDGRVAQEAIDRDVEAAQSLKAIGTPALMINGVLLGNVPDASALTERIEAVLGAEDEEGR